MKLIIFFVVALIALFSVSAKTTTEWGDVHSHKVLEFDRVLKKASRKHYQHVDIKFPNVSSFLAHIQFIFRMFKIFFLALKLEFC